MGEKRKTGWGRSPSTTQPRREKENTPATSPGLPNRSVADEKKIPDPIDTNDRPKTMESYEESLFDADHPISSPPKPRNLDLDPSVKRKSIPTPSHSPRNSISNSNVKPHPSPRATSRFHEEIDDDGPVAAPVPAVIAEEHQVWGEERKLDMGVDVGDGKTEEERRERSRDVAEAVVEATKTPISP